MQKKITLICLVIVSAVMARTVTSCSEKDEDIAAPDITIIQPAENDTIPIVNGFIVIEALAQDKFSVSNMEMKIRNKTGTVLYAYEKEDINKPAYRCHEQYYPADISGTTQMTLWIRFSNEYENSTSKTITFYVKP